MGILSWLKTSEKAVDTATNVVNGAVAGIDKLFFTEEEKADFSVKTMELWLKTQETLMNESTVKSITRRYLAFGITAWALLMGTGACVAYALHQSDLAQFILSVLKEYGFMVTAVVIFYFGYYSVQQIMKKK